MRLLPAAGAATAAAVLLTVVSFVAAPPAGPLDGDGDGIPDRVERIGWTSSDGHQHRTDPRAADSDRDGLDDGLEAGRLRRSTGEHWIYTGYSNPNSIDTDRDGVGDADELALDTDPRSSDTDGDELSDHRELEIDSDPTSANSDGDSYEDAVEIERGSDPLVYDLDAREASAAFLAGAAAGEWRAAAKLAGLSALQIDSPEYLAGQLASGFAGVGDVRDLVASLSQGEFIVAAATLAGLVPVAGDSAATISRISRFVSRGERAARAGRQLVHTLPLSAAVKARLLKTFWTERRAAARFLDSGARDTSVYVGRNAAGVAVYCGIAKNVAARQRQHGDRFTLTTIVARLTRNRARAVEEACILRLGLVRAGGGENRIHSIDPRRDVYRGALAYGERELRSVARTLGKPSP